MEDKTTNIVHEDSMTGFLRLLYKNIIWMVIITILCASLAIGYSMLTVKPTYTANRSVILRRAVGKEDTELDTVTRNPNTATNNATLAKIYLYDVAETITSPVMIEKANQTFGEEIDRYTMDQAVADGLTVPIKYHPRIAKVLLDNEKVKQIENILKLLVMLIRLI